MLICIIQVILRIYHGHVYETIFTPRDVNIESTFFGLVSDRSYNLGQKC